MGLALVVEEWWVVVEVLWGVILVNLGFCEGSFNKGTLTGKIKGDYLEGGGFKPGETY